MIQAVSGAQLYGDLMSVPPKVSGGCSILKTCPLPQAVLTWPLMATAVASNGIP
jgi:hypothetical protein